MLKTLDVQLQAEKLNEFVKRGGNADLWFQTKGFDATDKQMVMQKSIELKTTGSHDFGRLLDLMYRKQPCYSGQNPNSPEPTTGEYVDNT